MRSLTLLEKRIEQTKQNTHWHLIKSVQPYMLVAPVGIMAEGFVALVGGWPILLFSIIGVISTFKKRIGEQVLPVFLELLTCNLFSPSCDPYCKLFSIMVLAVVMAIWLHFSTVVVSPTCPHFRINIYIEILRKILCIGILVTRISLKIMLLQFKLEVSASYCLLILLFLIYRLQIYEYPNINTEKLSITLDLAITAVSIVWLADNVIGDIFTYGCIIAISMIGLFELPQHFVVWRELVMHQKEPISVDRLGYLLKTHVNCSEQQEILVECQRRKSP